MHFFLSFKITDLIQAIPVRGLIFGILGLGLIFGILGLVFCIIQSKKNEIAIKKEEEIKDEAKKTITSIAKDFEKNEKKIGEELLQANLDYREQQKIENTLMQCPKCKIGNLAITYSKKTRRFFIACDSYPECKNTFSLPPNGIIKKTDKYCEHCNFPILIRLSKGKRPWEFCFNRECFTNKERIEEYNKKKESENNSEEEK